MSTTNNIQKYEDLTTDNILEYLESLSDFLASFLFYANFTSDLTFEKVKKQLEDIIEDIIEKDELKDFSDSSKNILTQLFVDNPEILKQSTWSGGEGGRFDYYIWFLKTFDKNVHAYAEFDSWDGGDKEFSTQQLEPVTKIVWERITT